MSSSSSRAILQLSLSPGTGPGCLSLLADPSGNRAPAQAAVTTVQDGVRQPERERESVKGRGWRWGSVWRGGLYMGEREGVGWGCRRVRR